MSDKGRPTFTLRLEALPDVDAIKALRALLKVALRRYGLRCTGISEESTPSNKEND
jgi:hypothetical protein